jgi:hypothetical protein
VTKTIALFRVSFWPSGLITVTAMGVKSLEDETEEMVHAIILASIYWISVQGVWSIKTFIPVWKYSPEIVIRDSPLGDKTFGVTPLRWGFLGCVVDLSEGVGVCDGAVGVDDNCVAMGDI